VFLKGNLDLKVLHTLFRIHDPLPLLLCRMCRRG
jgi:hypothetical protein